MQSRGSSKKDEGNKVRFHGLALAAQGRSGIKSQSLAFQNSKWSTINPKSKELETLESGVPGMTTVYVGKIPQGVPDSNIRKLLNECGNIMRWNRSIDPTTKKLSSFGLCEFDSPVGVINAVNVLNGVRILGNQLLVKYQHGIDSEMAKWQNNRINDMLKQRGGDCTIETVLNELSVSDSKMRASIHRLLVAMHYDYDDAEQESKSELKQDDSVRERETEQSDQNISCCSEEGVLAEYKLPVGFKKHPKEKHREVLHREMSEKFDFRMKELNEKIYCLVKAFPGSMDLSNDLTTDYLIEVLEESYFRSRKINKHKKEVVGLISNLIDYDHMNDFSESDSEKEERECETDEHKVADKQMESESEAEVTESGGNGAIQEIESSLIHADTSQKADNIGETSTNNSNEAKIKLSLFGAKKSASRKNNERKVVSDFKVTQAFLDNPEFKSPVSKGVERTQSSAAGCASTDRIISNTNKEKLESELTKKSTGSDTNESEISTHPVDSDILLSDNWNIIFECSANINAHRDYIAEEMRNIIGDSDQEALSMITEFVLRMFSHNSRHNIQNNIKVLKEVLDDETERFLKGLYTRIIQG